MITTGLKSRITSNLFLLTQPLFSQPFTLSLFLRFPLTERALHNANANVKAKARREERERERERERPYLSGKKLVSTVGSLPNFPSAILFASLLSAKRFDKLPLVLGRRGQLINFLIKHKTRYLLVSYRTRRNNFLPFDIITYKRFGNIEKDEIIMRSFN